MQRIALLITLALAAHCGYAQIEATQYFMTSIPQVSVNNPAFIPRYNYSIGIPASSVVVGYSNNGFSYNDMISKSQGEVKGDLSKWVKALSDKNYISSSAQMDLLRVGFKAGPKLYFQLSSTAVAYSRVMIPKEAASLFVEGTAPLIGTNVTFSPQAEGIAYVETALGASVKATERLTVGARFKYLSGLSNVTTESSSVDVSVGDDYKLTAASDLMVKTSGINDAEHTREHAFSNTGFGIDLGGTLKLTKKLTVAASIVDMGRITWKNDLYSYSLNKNTARYSFAGIDLKEVVNGNSGYLDAKFDSLEDKFTPAENKIGAYSTALPARMYLSGNYELSRTVSLGGLLFSERFQGRVSPGVSASVNKHFGKWLDLLASYTVSNRSYNNFGLGLSLNLAPVQFYLVGDNLLRMPASLIATQELNSYINNTKLFNLRFGMNIVWGRDKSLDKLARNTKSYNSKGKDTKEKVTDGDASYLKARKKRR